MKRNALLWIVPGICGILLYLSPLNPLSPFGSDDPEQTESRPRGQRRFLTAPELTADPIPPGAEESDEPLAGDAATEDIAADSTGATEADEPDATESATAGRSEPAAADSASASNEADDPKSAASPAEDKPPKPDPPFPGLTPLSEEYPVWADKEQKRIVMIGEVCLRTGLLEMFACQKGTKEHESILAIDTKAFIVHAGLVALGAEPGHPVEYQPEFRPPAGPVIEITLIWKDAEGNEHHARAQDWIRDYKTKAPLEHEWVFAGSGYWTDPRTGERFYTAEEGDFICVSNFSSAMLDLAVESSQDTGALMFEAFEEKIPPRDTKVTIILTPKLGDAATIAPESPRSPE